MGYTHTMSAEHTRQEEVKKHKIIFAIAGILLLIVIVSIPLSKPKRSVAAFCNTYKQEDARLANSNGDTYSLKPFTHSSSNSHDFVTALDNLDQVAPKDIQPDVKTLKQIFEKIDKDSSQAISASLSGLGAESSVSRWTDKNCK